MPEENVAASHLSTEEISAAIRDFSQADWLRLKKVAKNYASHGVEAADLLQTAFLRALEEGGRKCPRHVDVVRFLAEAIRSIASGARKSQQRKPELRLVDGMSDTRQTPEDPRPPQQTPEELVCEDEKCGGIRKAVLALFDDDEVAHMIVEGMMEGMEGEDLMALTDLDKTAFASKRRLIRRRIEKAFPEGWRS